MKQQFGANLWHNILKQYHSEKQKIYLQLLEKYPPPPHFWEKFNVKWLRGFIQGDGGFHVNFRRDRKRLRINCKFALTQHKRSFYVLLATKQLLGCGGIICVRNNIYEYKEQGFNSLLKKVSPLFLPEGFQNTKQSDFLYQSAILTCVNSKLHLQSQYFKQVFVNCLDTKIKRLKELQSRCITSNQYQKHIQDLQNKMCQVVPYFKTYPQDMIIPYHKNSTSEEFVTGLVDADGSFVIKLAAITHGWPLVRVDLVLSISAELNSKEMLRKIQKQYLKNSGNIYVQGNKCYLLIGGFKTIDEVVLPYFRKYPLLTSKYGDFLLFERVANIIKSNRNKSIEGMEEILRLGFQSNSGKDGKSLRAHTEAQYLEYLHLAPDVQSYRDLKQFLPQLKEKIMVSRHKSKRDQEQCP